MSDDQDEFVLYNNLANQAVGSGLTPTQAREHADFIIDLMKQKSDVFGIAKASEETSKNE